MKLISWNVNGLRACLKKGFEDTFNQLAGDLFRLGGQNAPYPVIVQTVQSDLIGCKHC